MQVLNLNSEIIFKLRDYNAKFPLFTSKPFVQKNDSHPVLLRYKHL